MSKGIPFDERLVVEGDFRMESGHEAMGQLMEWVRLQM